MTSPTTFTNLAEQIKERLVLSEIIGTRVRLQRKGRAWLGLCPFHTEKTPSFTVMDDKGYYHCFGCGAHGDVLSFIMALDRLDFMEALTQLAPRAGVSLPPPKSSAKKNDPRRHALPAPDDSPPPPPHSADPSALHAAPPQGRLLVSEPPAPEVILGEASRWYRHQLPKNAAATSYLEARNFKEATLEIFQIGFAPQSLGALTTWHKQQGFTADDLLYAGLLGKDATTGSLYPRFRDRIVFPIQTRKGDVVGFGGRVLEADKLPKYLNSADSEHFHKGRLLYGLHQIAQRWPHQQRVSVGSSIPRGALDDRLLVVEGYGDVMALQQAGFQAVAPLGTALTEDQIRLAWKIDPTPLLCFDGDAAGQRAALRALDRALPLLKPGHSFDFVFLPPGEDPDSLLASGHGALLVQLCQKARPLADVLWHHLSHTAVLTTPEQIAHFRHVFRQRLDTLTDEGLKYAYHQDFKHRFSTLLRGLTTQNYTPSKKSKAQMSLQQDKLLISAPHHTKASLLVATLLHHPSIFEAVESDVLHIPLEGELKNFLMTLIDEISLHPAIENCSMGPYLDTKGYGKTVAKLSAPAIFDLAPFAHPSAPVEEALQGWRMLWRIVAQGASLDHDIAALTRAFKVTPEVHLWERLKAITQLRQSLESDTLADDVS